MINAAIFIGPDLPWDGEEARQCHAQVVQRDYHLAALLRDWEDLDRVLVADDVKVVVFPATLIKNAKVFDPDVTKVLRRHNAAIGRHRMPPADGVREIRFGDGVRPGEPEYDTAPILPRGNDGGFAERFLNERRDARDT